MIQTFGMTDNYNMEYTEWLHIDLAKDAYYDEVARAEGEHEQFIKWCLDGDHAPHHLHPPDLCFDHTQQLTKHTSAKTVPIQKLITDYGATYFQQALTRYIAQQQNPNESALLEETSVFNPKGKQVQRRSRVKWWVVASKLKGNAPKHGHAEPKHYRVEVE
ncbi:uncharacterized protein F5891DRAFT_984460 [Suillus fuscotomentosus]|uniref:Uncharacterized protein n=1 Tax=Suillus fuscotomentosus TaxID=1912939 RepID=A0AAD4HGA5_9AGAM|nr:uncharacterized protein F5891DRAFT_984460 [Suillus fuscotomentosus]KAG1895136.1 hypothetical protein F5891DRAFT_984460 [Suillus fuscotomentosus]